MRELFGGRSSAGVGRSLVRLYISRFARWVGSTPSPSSAYAAAVASSPWIQAIWASRAKEVAARFGAAVARRSWARASS